LKAQPVPLQEFPAPVPVAESKEKPVEKPAEKPVPQFVSETKETKEKSMAMSEPASNMQSNNNRQANGPMAPKLSSMMSSSAANEPYKQEVKTVSKNNSVMENDAVECDLRVANKIIDEAIRNEMRLSDVVRRIIELPVSDQE